MAAMNGFVEIAEYLVKEHSVSLNTATIPVGDAPLFADTKSVSQCIYIVLCM